MNVTIAFYICSINNSCVISNLIWISLWSGIDLFKFIYVLNELVFIRITEKLKLQVWFELYLSIYIESSLVLLHMSYHLMIKTGLFISRISLRQKRRFKTCDYGKKVSRTTPSCCILTWNQWAKNTTIDIVYALNVKKNELNESANNMA